MIQRRILLIDNCDFKNFPVGGTLTFASQLIKAIAPDKISLVGVTTQDMKIGKWSSIVINGKEYEFFPIMRVTPRNRKPLIPLRITSFFALLRYLRRIRRKGYYYLFTQTPQFLFALNFFRWKSVCFNFPGVSNSVAISRYKRLRFFGSLYESLLFRILKKKVIRILAAADRNAIDKLVKRSKGLLDRKQINTFPTRFDDGVFNVKDKESSRTILGLPMQKKIFVSVGRLSWIKGWDLLIEVLKLRKNEDCMLILVGDGEDRLKIEKLGKDLIDKGVLKITGYITLSEVAVYLNSADLVLVGSYEEGWPTSIIEALACGKAVVSTNVSGSTELIKSGVNGFIVDSRDPALFNQAITDALKLKDYVNYDCKISQRYSIKNLFLELQTAWPELSEPVDKKR